MPCDLVARAAWAPLTLRLAVGAVFLAHGLPKLRTAWDRPGDTAQAAGAGPAGGAGSPAFFAALRWPAPSVVAAAVGVVEFAGGLSLLAGAGTRLSALLLAALLGVAIAKVKWMRGFVGGSELEFTLLAACLALALLGGGPLAIASVG